jgi:hypothetical protein
VSIYRANVERLRAYSGGVTVYGNLGATGTCSVTGAISTNSTVTATGNIQGAGITATANIQGVDINATGVYKVDGTQVVGNQGTAVADVASADAPAQTAAYVQADVEAIRAVANEAKAQLNTLLARLRAHGLIAT